MSKNNVTEKLVQRVNELYHDRTSEEYHHPEIFNEEKERWKKIAQKFFIRQQPITVLEIGSGTGFVPLTVADVLKKEDRFICSDISSNMLLTCEKNIRAANFKCQFNFLKIEPTLPYHVNVDSNCADIILMNSVLHHIQDSAPFLNEMDRILKKDGLLIIGHEPNKNFFDSLLMKGNYFLLNSLSSPRYFAMEVARKTGIKRLLRNIRNSLSNSAVEKNELADSINEILINENLITEKLTIGEIERLVDIKSEEGFTPDKLLAGYEVAYLETYNHLYWLYLKFPKNKFVNSYNSFLKNTFPGKGSTFFVVIRKK